MVQLCDRDASFLAERIEASGQPQVFGGEHETLTQLFATCLLDDLQEGVTKLVSRLDHGSFAVVVPRDQLDERPRTLHTYFQSFLEGFAVSILKMLLVL